MKRIHIPPYEVMYSMQNYYLYYIVYKKAVKEVVELRWTYTRGYFPKCKFVYTVSPQYSCK